jgi:hypothetical protein
MEESLLTLLMKNDYKNKSMKKSQSLKNKIKT